MATSPSQYLKSTIKDPDAVRQLIGDSGGDVVYASEVSVVPESDQLQSQNFLDAVVGPGGAVIQHAHPVRDISNQPYSIRTEPTSGVSGAGVLGGGGNILFNVNTGGNQNQLIRAVYLEYDIENSSATNTVTLVPNELLFASTNSGKPMLSLYWNNNQGDNLTWYSDILYHQRLLMREKRDLRVLLASVNNMNADTFQGQVAMAPTTTHTYRLQVPGPWDYLLMPLGLQQYLNFSFNLDTRSPVQTVAPGPFVASELSLLNPRLIIEPVQVTAAQYQAITSTYTRGYNGNGLILKTLDHTYETQTQTLATNSDYTLTLQSLQGISAELDLAVTQNSSPAVATDSMTLMGNRIQTILPYRADGSQTLFINSNPIPVNYLRTTQVALNGIQSFATSIDAKSLIPLMFAAGGNPGLIRGSVKLAGFQYVLRNVIKYRTNAAATPGTYQFLFHMFRLNFLMIDTNSFRIRRAPGA